MAKIPLGTTPLEPHAPTIEDAQHVAGGLEAVTSSLRHALSQMGIRRTMATLGRVNQFDGFDCPGCAWPDPDTSRSVTEFCENGAKAVADEATRQRANPEFFHAHTIGSLIERSDHWLGHQGRLTHPMWRRAGADHYEIIAWPDAFDRIAATLRSLESPDRAAFYTSGRTSNEAAFLYQLFVRLYGTNNLPDCSNMCHESSGVGLTETIGIGKGTVTLGDFERADTILVIGQNPGTNHPRMLTALQAAVRGGCRVVSINPLAEAGLERFQHPQSPTDLVMGGTPLASSHLPVRVNGDVALLKGLMKVMLDEERRAPGTVVDRAFVEGSTEGFAAFAADLEAESWERITEQSGIDRERIAEVAGVLARSERLICCWAMGLTQHENAVGNIQEIVNLLLLGGHFGRPGAGACPVRGHSNVQGDRTVGIVEKPKAEFLDRLGAAFGFDPPREHGLDTVGAIEAMAAGNVDVLFAMGGNFLSATPDTEATVAAIQRCRLTVHVSTKLNRAHLVTGREALILPCLGRTECDVQASGPQFVTTENSMGVVQTSRGTLEPASPALMSEPAIVAGLAEAVFDAGTPGAAVDWAGMVADYDRIREQIERLLDGFDDYNRRVRSRGGFYLPNPVRDERRFATPSGKAHFTVHAIPQPSLRDGELLMTTIRSHDQYNTTVYGLDDRYRGVLGGRRVVFVNEADLESRGLAAGALVDLVSHFRGETRRAPAFRCVPYAIPLGCVATYFPEANVLVPLGSRAAKSNTPASKSVVVTLEACRPT